MHVHFSLRGMRNVITGAEYFNEVSVVQNRRLSKPRMDANGRESIVFGERVRRLSKATLVRAEERFSARHHAESELVAECRNNRGQLTQGRTERIHRTTNSGRVAPGHGELRFAGKCNWVR